MYVCVTQYTLWLPNLEGKQVHATPDQAQLRFSAPNSWPNYGNCAEQADWICSAPRMQNKCMLQQNTLAFVQNDTKHPHKL